MRNTVRLTERDLTRLVKQIINETIIMGCSTTGDLQNYASNPITNATVNGQNVNFTFKDNRQCFITMPNDGEL